MNNVHELLDQIIDIIEEGKTSLSGSKVRVEREALLDIVNEIRTQLPEELIEARRIINRKFDIIEKANATKEEIIMKAQREAEQLVEDNNIVKTAKHNAAEIIAMAKGQADDIISKANAEAQAITGNAETWARKLKSQTAEYVDNVFSDCDEVLSTTVDELGKKIKEIRNVRNQVSKSTANLRR